MIVKLNDKYREQISTMINCEHRRTPFQFFCTEIHLVHAVFDNNHKLESAGF